MNPLKLVLISGLSLTLVACGADDNDAASSGEAQLTVGTFNVGMARGYVDHAEERFEHVIAAIRDLEETDVLCVQEMWLDDDIDALKSGVSDTYPEVYMHRSRLTDFPMEESATPPCTMEESAPLIECAVPLCDGEADLATCVISNCNDEFDALSGDCQECAAGNLTLGNVPAIVEACTTGQADRYSYDGHNGLLLLSKRPITNTNSINLSSFLTVRSVLYGEVDGLGIACTHLSATLSEPVYNGEYDSYGAENAAQVARLLEYTTEQSGDLPAVIAGDFNAGPAAGSDIAADLPESYALFESDGWVDASLASGMPECTWCADNPLTGGGSQNSMLDHIVVKGAESSDYQRVFDGRIDIEKEDGTLLNVCLSDHYGLTARITW